ncbi:MAG: hypothetical protein PHN74_00240 [Candidatus Pacebacteria bacterium]|nr:hypothetical protein [Candidatus Paceibacterota bacterium]
MQSDCVEGSKSLKGGYVPLREGLDFKGSAVGVVRMIFQEIDRPLFEEDILCYAEIFSKKKFGAARIKTAISCLNQQGAFERIGNKYCLKSEFSNKKVSETAGKKTKEVVVEATELASVGLALTSAPVTA